MPEDSADRSGVRRIGRYEIAGRLATGGMAEILLGKLLGPAGFERPVVIKRILPHLAELSSFRDMFLDEARLVARIRHPNVAQVTELGTDGEDLFLVMEYLEGESLGGLMRRLFARKETLPPALAAHIVAEVCAGLHAAHELCDDDGRHDEVVHRDVSPQNVIVTYDGAVKVLDFGIAKAAHRISRTEAGQVKGKFEYMSPEQCKGESLDRRSDIFSVGTLLYELATGTRLWKRESSMLTMLAVCEESAPALSRLNAAAWPLDEICSRALEKTRERRPATAQELRRVLLEAVKCDEIALEGVADVELGQLMRRLFDDRIDEKRELLRGVKAGEASVTIPRAESDEFVEVPTREATLLTGALSGRTLDAGSPTRSASRFSTRALLGGALGLSVLALGAFGWRWTAGSPVAAPSSTSMSPDLRDASSFRPSVTLPSATAQATASSGRLVPSAIHERARGSFPPRVSGAGVTSGSSSSAALVASPGPSDAPVLSAPSQPSASGAPARVGVPTASAKPGFTRF